MRRVCYALTIIIVASIGFMPMFDSLADEPVMDIEPDPVTIEGDVNGDSIVNVMDVVLLRNILTDHSPASDGADVNRDGNVNVADLVVLLNILTNHVE